MMYTYSPCCGKPIAEIEHEEGTIYECTRCGDEVGYEEIKD